jgi:hypothetical protein
MHLQIADWYAPVKIFSSAEYSVLQALQFQKVTVCHIFPGGTGVSHNALNQRFVKRDKE